MAATFLKSENRIILSCHRKSGYRAFSTVGENPGRRSGASFMMEKSFEKRGSLPQRGLAKDTGSSNRDAFL
jgi:hypothetical protein